MKRIKTYLLLLVVVAAWVSMSSCVGNRYLTTDDDEWSNADWGNENLLLNGELEIDDYER